MTAVVAVVGTAVILAALTPVVLTAVAVARAKPEPPEPSHLDRLDGVGRRES